MDGTLVSDNDFDGIEQCVTGWLPAFRKRAYAWRLMFEDPQAWDNGWNSIHERLYGLDRAAYSSARDLAKIFIIIKINHNTINIICCRLALCIVLSPVLTLLLGRTSVASGRLGWLVGLSIVISISRKRQCVWLEPCLTWSCRLGLETLGDSY